MSSSSPIRAFTTKTKSGLMNRLMNTVCVEAGSKTLEAIALWDTGATGTCISTTVVKSLNLIPTGKKNIRTPSGQSIVNTYLINILLPNNVRISDVEVCDSEIGNQGLGVLIGMDIITQGDFAVSNYNGRTAFSFRIPSQNTTDYVVQANIYNLVGTHGKGKRKHRK